MGLLDAVSGTALVLWTGACVRGLVYFSLCIGWKNKRHPPPGRLKVLAWRVGLAVAAAALPATPPLVLWFGITRGFWITVTVQAALCAAALCFLATRRHHNRRPPPPGARRPRPPQPTPEEPEPPTPAPWDER
ncbi:hypothetical protein ABGB09_24875 [Streptomyces sp. B8F3]|uniref:hypothetical protein n=1 Tax=Streptomyces sp. B8F3 TaxID=3153573 RepID=UPI00325E2F45